MHELSIALSILDCAAEESERRGGIDIAAIHIRLGPLSGVVKDALLSAYGVAAKDSEFPRSRLIITEMPVVAFCETCGVEREIPSVQEIRCPVCQSPTPDIRGGRELEVTAMEITDDIRERPH